MKIKPFFLVLSLFRGLTPLKFKIFDKKLKISKNTQNLDQRSYRDSIINRPLHHIMKIKFFQFFSRFRHFFRELTPLKFKNFDQKLIISNNTQNFAKRSYIEIIINRPLHHTIKIKYFQFFLDFVTFFVG